MRGKLAQNALFKGFFPIIENAWNETIKTSYQRKERSFKAHKNTSTNSYKISHKLDKLNFKKI